MFSVYPRGGGAGFWDKLCPCGRESCAITHTNTLRTATRSPGQGAEQEELAPYKYTHPYTSPLAFSIPPFVSPSAVTVQLHLLCHRVGSRAHRHHPGQTAGLALLCQEVSSLLVLQIPARQLSAADLHQPIISIVVFHCEYRVTQHRNSLPVARGSSLLHVQYSRPQLFAAHLLEPFSNVSASVTSTLCF